MLGIVALGSPENFQGTMYGAHCAVIFAIAQLSCLIFDMLIRSGDIRDQSRKLSEIAPNFGPFFAIPNFLGAGLPKILPNLSLMPLGTSTEKVL